MTTLVGTPSTWRTWSCKSGRHRSLANQRVLQFIVEDYGVPQWDLNHLNQFGCADCRWEAPGAREKAMVCGSFGRKTLKSLKPQRPAEPAPQAVQAQQVTPHQGALLQHQMRQAHQCRPSPSLQWSRPAGAAKLEPGSHVQGADEGGACEQARGQASTAGLCQADSKGQGPAHRG